MSVALAIAPARPGPAPAPRAHRPPYLRAVRTAQEATVPTAPSLSTAPLTMLATRPQEAAAPFTTVEPDATHLRSLHGPAADPARVCASILQVAGEAMRGMRPLSQLTRWVDGEIFDELAAFAPTHGARTSVRQRLEPGSVAAVLAQSRLRKIRAARISPHVAECTVLVETAGRVRAVVVRLEERRSSWRATTLSAV